MTKTTTRNRGQHPNDTKIFAPKWYPIFKEAVDDLCYLLSRGYGGNSSVEIVGNRYKLNKRQRMTVSRIAAREEEVLHRKSKEISIGNLVGKTVEIDGFNLLILLENALSGAYVFKCRDGTYWDISSVHGSYKRVTKTELAIEMVGDILQKLQVGKVKWLLDSPVSNSGKLLAFLAELSERKSYDWDMELVFDPDKVLAVSEFVVVTSDGEILDSAKAWVNLGGYLVDNYLESVSVVDV
jgi:hypothetical protein